MDLSSFLALLQGSSVRKSNHARPHELKSSEEITDFSIEIIGENEWTKPTP